jgi:uncharacterized protein (DUF1697 family)
MRALILLGSINVGRNNRLPMADLRERLAGLGLRSVITYLQSGNVIAEWDGSPAALRQIVGESLADRLGKPVPVLVRGVDELRRAVAANPFPAAGEQDPAHLQVSFLATPLPAGELPSAVAALATDDELWALSPDRTEIYAFHPSGIHNSKLAGALNPRRLGVDLTARNYSTVLELLELLAASGS